MRKALLLAVLLPACVVGSDGQSPPPGGDDDTDPPPTNPGNITEATTFSGTVTISTATTIDPGVVVTVLPGTTLNFGPASNLTIKGTLDIQGTKAEPVTIQKDPASTQVGNFFGGFSVSGTLNMNYANMRSGSVVTSAGGTATIVDSKLLGASGDLLIMNGGTINMTYSQLGDAAATDTTHCNMHFGGNGNTILVNNSNIVGTAYGLMFYGGTGANFQNNNWDETATAAADWIDSQPGVAGDFSGGFFAAGPPTAKAGATLTINNPSPTRLTDAGPR